MMVNAGEMLPPCCFPKGHGEATITIGSINFLSRAESSDWTNDGNCEAIVDTARRVSAACRAALEIDAHIMIAQGFDNMCWAPALSKDMVMDDLRRNVFAIPDHAAHRGNCQPCFLVRKGAGITPIPNTTRGDKLWRALSIDFNGDSLTFFSIHWLSTPAYIVLDALRMAIRQAVVNDDKVIVAGTFFSCTPAEGPVKLMDMVEVVRTLCSSLRLLRGHEAQQGYTTAVGNSENGPTDFMFATKDFHADRHITSGTNFDDECNDYCGDMNNKLKRPTPHHPIATNITWKTNVPMESPIPEQPRENLTLWLDLPEAVAGNILEPPRGMGGNYVNDNGEHDRFSSLEVTELDVNSQAHVGLRFECHLPSSPHGITLHNRAIIHVDESGSLGRVVSSGNTGAHWPTTNDHIISVSGKDDVDWQLAHASDNGYTIMFRKGGLVTFPNGDRDYLGPVLPDAVHGEQFLPMPAAQCAGWFVNASTISIKHNSLAAETDAHPRWGTHYIALNLHRSFCPDTPANPDDQGPRHDNAVESSANGSACVYITGWESHITLGYLPSFNTQPPDPPADYIHDMTEEKRLFQEQILDPCQDVLDRWKEALATPKGFDSFINHRYIKHVNIGGEKDPKVWTPITRLNTERLRHLVNENLITCIGHEHWIDPKTKHELRNYFEMIHTREQERL